MIATTYEEEWTSGSHEVSSDGTQTRFASAKSPTSHPSGCHCRRYARCDRCRRKVSPALHRLNRDGFVLARQETAFKSQLKQREQRVVGQRGLTAERGEPGGRERWTAYPRRKGDVLGTLVSVHRYLCGNSQDLSKEYYFWRVLSESEILRICRRFIGVVVFVYVNVLAPHLHTLRRNFDELLTCL